ncbi:zinc-dependent metalloprotease [Actinomyces slackii]|uniref:Uncharacterized conserved protein n=1 Tax=Actinomyces slackii TaxID=52774 RepID=A0A448KBQ0_9ACTO|nr:zinc-dependent metalloprotease [Actinomyces slackii]VEG74347.1 Uncharacterized conserved protein [Actinomyces slackii]
MSEHRKSRQGESAGRAAARAPREPWRLAARAGAPGGEAAGEAVALGEEGTAAGLIDWQAVDRMAALVPPGPVVSRQVRAGTVAVLRRSALQAPEWIAEITGLRRAAAQVASHTDLRVVDRAGLIRASAASLRGLMAAVPAPPAARLTRTAGAVEVAGALSLISTRLLGQVLPGTHALTADPAPGGAGEPTPRLLLVAPNVLAVRRRLDLDLLDLPTWVALHETTHAIQLAAAPWLSEYLVGQARDVLRAVVRSIGGQDQHPALSRRMGRIGLGAVLAGKGPALDELLSASERAGLASLVAALTLLEGHAEAVLDSVGPTRIPSVHRLRAVLSRTGSDTLGVGPGLGVGSLLHRLVSLDAKEAQYVDGVAFARAVIARAGHEGLNRVWDGPELLPGPAEISRPDLWLERVG